MALSTRIGVVNVRLYGFIFNRCLPEHIGAQCFYYLTISTSSTDMLPLASTAIEKRLDDTAAGRDRPGVLSGVKAFTEGNCKY